MRSCRRGWTPRTSHSRAAPASVSPTNWLASASEVDRPVAPRRAVDAGDARARAPGRPRTRRCRPRRAPGGRGCGRAGASRSAREQRARPRRRAAPTPGPRRTASARRRAASGSCSPRRRRTRRARRARTRGSARCAADRGGAARRTRSAAAIAIGEEQRAPMRPRRAPRGARRGLRRRSLPATTRRSAAPVRCGLLSPRRRESVAGLWSLTQSPPSSIGAARSYPEPLDRCPTNPRAALRRCRPTPTRRSGGDNHRRKDLSCSHVA